MIEVTLPDDDGGIRVWHRKTFQEGNRVAPLAYRHMYACERNAKKNFSAYPSDDMEAPADNAKGQVDKIDVLSRRLETPMHNRALEKLQGELTVCQNLFETWYERKQAYDLLFSAGENMLDFLVNWRKPQYWKKHAKSVKPSTLPEAWLTYQFGIKPLVGTVNSAMLGLGQPLTSATFSGSSRQTLVFPISWTDVFAKCDYVYKLGCTVSPKQNPNMHLLNIGGITTPFSTAWSVIPWGWAVDYFFNVSQLLSNFEDTHPGVSITNTYVTRYNKGVWFGAHPTIRNGVPYCVYDGIFHYTLRDTSVPLTYRPELKFPKLGSNQVANLFSAIALTMKGKQK